MRIAKAEYHESREKQIKSENKCRASREFCETEKKSTAGKPLSLQTSAEEGT